MSNNRLHNNPYPRGLSVLVTWADLHGQLASETQYIEALKALSVRDALPALIRFLRFGDSRSASQFWKLDQVIERVVPASCAARVRRLLEGQPNRVFLNRWQLLATIKLLCVFGNTEDNGKVEPAPLLDVLLMTNDFVHRDYGEPLEDNRLAVFSQALKSMPLLHHEPPIMTVGRYSDLLTNRAAPGNRENFHTWIDIDSVLSSTLGFQLVDLESVLFSTYASIPTKLEARDDGEADLFPALEDNAAQVLPFCFDPNKRFTSTALDPDTMRRVLDCMTCSPEEVRAEHEAKYGHGIGRVFDLAPLLRKPILLIGEACSAALSHYSIIQRYTVGAYWDIHNALADDSGRPNRHMFQIFFGELHEDYGLDLLDRVTDRMARAGKQAKLIKERHYATGSEKTADGLLVETIGSTNVRCTMFEFTVGRPRYDASIVSGDFNAFSEDLERKLGSALDQELHLCLRLLSGDKQIEGLDAEKVKRWLFVLVVTDPFPSLEFLVESIQSKLDTLPQDVGVTYQGPYILSLYELELLESLRPKRISDVFHDWNSGPYRQLPFELFCWSRTKGYAPRNTYVEEKGMEAISRATIRVFPEM